LQVPVETCSYLIELDYPQRYLGQAVTGEHARRHAVEAEYWHRVKCLPFVDLQNSARLSRSFYFPFVKDGNTYGDYCLLRNKRIVNLPDSV